MREGDFSDAVYLICSGNVRLVRFSPGGLEVFLAHRITGDLIGESGLISGAPRNCSIFAEDQVTAIRLSRAVFERLLENRAFVSAILTQLSVRLTEASERAFSVSALPIQARVAAELLRRARRDGAISGEIAEPVIITELAFHVSATRESVSKIVNEWIREGILSKSGTRLAVERADRLVAAVELGV